MRDHKPRAQLLSEISAHFRLHPPFKDIDSVLKQFYADLKEQ